MKKTIALLFAAVMLVVSVFAGMTMAAEKEELVGEWHISKAKQGEMEMDASILTMMGMDMILTLNEDGTVVMDSMGNLQEGTWKSDGEGGILAFENEVPFTLEDGNLVIDQNGMSMTFAREAASAADVTLAPAVTDAKAEDFNGTWKATIYNFLGMALPLNSLGVNITLTIGDGTVVFYEEVSGFTNPEDEVPEPVEAELASEMQEDGTLLVDMGDSDILSQIGMTASAIILTLHEDGKISGTSPEIMEGLEAMNSMSEEDENTAAEEADEDAAEELIVEEAAGEDVGAGDSEGSSGDSSADSMQMYILFERAE